jgi:hypothetical protein
MVKESRGKKLTKSFIDNIPIPSGEKLRPEYPDSEISGFRLRVSSSGKKVFIFRRRVNGKPQTTTIGEFGPWTVGEARKHAKEISVKYDKGVSVNAEKRAARAKGATLNEMFTSYLELKDLKPSTRRVYKGDIENHLSDWRTKPLKEITSDMVRGCQRS